MKLALALVLYLLLAGLFVWWLDGEENQWK